MKLNSLIERLAAYEPGEAPFVSLYLDASSAETGRDAFKVWFKKRSSETLAEISEDTDRSGQVEAALDKISEFLDEQVEASANGVAVFCGNVFFQAVQLDVPFPNNRLTVWDRPHIFPLARIREQNPAYAVLWTDTNKADIYIFGGERSLDVQAETDSKVQEIESTKTNRSQVGGWSQARYQRHIENFHQQHAREAVAALEKLMQKNGVKHLVLCGDEATIMPILRPELSKEMESAIVAILPMDQYASEDEIREITRAAMDETNATRDAEMVESVFNAARAAAGLGTLGMDKTLAALSNGQVQQVVMAADFDAIRYNTKTVEKVLNDYAPGDDNSGERDLPETTEKRQVVDEVIVRAINSAAEIVFVEDSALLAEAGGIGAVLRYNLNAVATS